MHCGNCGSTDLHARYEADQMGLGELLRIWQGPCYAEPHTHWKCKRCKFTWITFM